jgi:hypothetical protein
LSTSNATDMPACREDKRTGEGSVQH